MSTGAKLEAEKSADWAGQSQTELGRPTESLEPELDCLRVLAGHILSRRREITVQWRDLYVRAWVSTGASKIKRDDFFHLLGDAIARNKDDLLRRDLASYATDARRLGQHLCERKVPLAEVLAISHLFQASVFKVIPDVISFNETQRVFEALGVARSRLMVEAYAAQRPSLSLERPQRGESAQANAAKAAIERWADPRVPRLVGKGPAMRQLAERILALATCETTALLVGETGTGKELVARAIHECGAGSDAPFVPFNCAAIPKDLIESELFGYRKGAFSGANADAPGLFRSANGGTLFLDEVTEMDPEFQGKLLRALQEKAVRPVGSPREFPITARIIASTNRNPEEAMYSGQLRRDLYYRLQASVVRVPPLRERRGDIPLLLEHFIALLRTRPGASAIVGIEPGALRAMMHYEWPGNVRELANVVESAGLFGKGPAITRNDLPAKIAGQDLGGIDNLTHPGLTAVSLRDAERHLIQATLAATHGNKALAAAQLRISRKTLYAKLARYGLRDL